MKVYVVTYDYKPTDSLWGDEYYDRTILLKTYQDENKAKDLCDYCNKLIEDFYGNDESEEDDDFESGIVYVDDDESDEDDNRELEIIYNGEHIITIEKDHEEDGYVSYMEFELE